MVVSEIDPAIRRLMVGEVNGPDAPGFALPTGTVSFLLTDVEGSSRRWERAPDGMAVAIPRHFEILGEVIAAPGGVGHVQQGGGGSVVGALGRAWDGGAGGREAHGVG